jgi:signal transduction histidine kinase
LEFCQVSRNRCHDGYQANDLITAVDPTYIFYVFFVYGLAFFSMGFAIILELAHGSDVRLRHALRPLAVFGFLHGIHEWLEMFSNLSLLPAQDLAGPLWAGLRLAFLAFSFLSLSEFGASLLAKDDRLRRLSLLLPLSLAAIWGLGLFIMRGRFQSSDLLDIADVWTRYVLGGPSGLVACAGLIAQQREFRRVGMAEFGRDSLWAAIAFAWYGLVGQLFTRASPLPPSTIINEDLFLHLFGFPIQLLRAVVAGMAAIFVMRFLASFEVEVQRQIASLQAARLRDAQRREALRGDLLHRIVEAQEAERQRIARELHDETGQALTAIGLGLRGISANLKDLDKASQNLRRLERMVDHSLDELQRLISDLRPSHLDDLGLPAALRWYAGEVQARTSLPVNFEVIGEQQTLSTEAKTTLFRVVQEALTNAVRHAGANQTRVQLIFGDGLVTVRIEDDGCGFDPSKANAMGRPSWGLEGMRERASLLGGVFQVRSAPGQGTLVEVSLPYKPNMEMNDDDPPVTGR